MRGFFNTALKNKKSEIKGLVFNHHLTGSSMLIIWMILLLGKRVGEDDIIVRKPWGLLNQKFVLLCVYMYNLYSVNPGWLLAR